MLVGATSTSDQNTINNETRRRKSHHNRITQKTNRERSLVTMFFCTFVCVTRL